jgi:hypothetical protein
MSQKKRKEFVPQERRGIALQSRAINSFPCPECKKEMSVIQEGSKYYLTRKCACENKGFYIGSAK